MSWKAVSVLCAILICVGVATLGFTTAIAHANTAQQATQRAHYLACAKLPVKQHAQCVEGKQITIIKTVYTHYPPTSESGALSECRILASSMSNGDGDAGAFGACLLDVAKAWGQGVAGAPAP